MKIIHIVILALFLQGCVLLEKKPDPIIPPLQIVHIDSVNLEYCPQLNENLQLSTFDQFILVYGDLATSYAKCANKQSSSVKLLKQLGNIK